VLGPSAGALAVTELPPGLRPGPTQHYRGITHAFRSILRHEGVPGLYRGLGATLMQVSEEGGGGAECDLVRERE
jgi:hypothetical protein